MRKLAFVSACALLVSLALVGCGKTGGGDAAGKTIKDSKTGQDLSTPVELPVGGPPAAVKPPEAKAPAADTPEAAKPEAGKADAK